MKSFQSIADLPHDAQDAVIAVGNFDGVHRGHQALLAQAKALAAKFKKKLGVLTFEPHPRRLFRPDEPAFRLTPPSVKARRLADCGVDLLFSLPFNWDFASQSAEAFIKTILTDGIKPAYVIVGADFRFGQLRKGTPETLRAAGLNVTAIEKINDTTLSDAVSSSTIRQALRQGDIETANRLLGWPWAIEGVVMHGDKRGRELGFPTANVPLGETLHPSYGIYASLVRIGNDPTWYPSAANIGIRPMFEVAQAQMETFIFDFNRDIYGEVVHVRPVQRLRGEAKFDSLETLITQMNKDCDQARAILAAHK